MLNWGMKLMTKSTKVVELGRGECVMELKCPHCGNSEEFRYLETVEIITTRVVGKVRDGVLQIEADPEYDTDATRVGEGGQYPRFECGGCDGECFPVPTGLKLDFVGKLDEDEDELEDEE